MRVVAFLLVNFAVMPGFAGAEPSVGAPAFSGVATVVDGDGLEVGGVSVRLFGIDAPEISQYCRASSGVRWKCGQYSTVELDRAVSGKRVSCTPREKDPYGRVVAVCELDGRDIAKMQVRAGWALAYRRYSENYVADESAAREAKRGVWAADFEMPWEYRQRNRKPR